MAAVGGSVESITLDGRNFSVAADAEGQRKIGGYENEVQPNGDGTSRLIKMRVPWQLEGLTIEIDDSRDDDEFVQALANRGAFFPISATYASGAIWQGTGQITGENPTSSQSATKQISLMGQGQFTQQ